MRYEYSITAVPPTKHGYDPICHIEGNLRVHIGGSIFVESAGILLVELAVVLQEWLLRIGATGPSEDLYYASMDFEEEPVLALRYDAGTSSYRAESVWAACASDAVEPPVAASAARSFIASLERELGEVHSIDLRRILAQAGSF